nr:magnesium transporter protein 1 [Hymenolepis microstoma]
MPYRRNFSIVFIIASKKAQCDPCGPAIAALTNIADKWRKDHQDSSEIFFGFIDFLDNMDFVKMLDIHTAPFIYHIGPLQSVREWDKVNDFKIVSHPVLLAAWISKLSNIKVEASIPMDMSLIYLVSLLLITAYIFYKIKWFRSVKFVGIVCLFFICAMLSGLMFVNIHNTPFISSQGGQVTFIYPRNGAQLGSEVLLIMFLYAMTSGGVVLLTTNCPKYRNRKFLHSIGVLMSLALTVIGFNQLAACYTGKTGQTVYHFSLF